MLLMVDHGEKFADDQSLTSVQFGRRCLGTNEYEARALTQNTLTFFEQDALQERILIPKHEAFIRRRTVTLLEGLEGLFMVLDGRLQLFDILCASFPERRLSLTVPLLPLLRCCVYLYHWSH